MLVLRLYPLVKATTSRRQLLKQDEKYKLVFPTLFSLFLRISVTEEVLDYNHAIIALIKETYLMLISIYIN